MNNANKPARAWLLELMGEHDFTMPTKAFNGIAQEIARFETLNHGLRNRNDHLAVRVLELEACVINLVTAIEVDRESNFNSRHPALAVNEKKGRDLLAALATTKEQHD